METKFKHEAAAWGITLPTPLLPSYQHTKLDFENNPQNKTFEGSYIQVLDHATLDRLFLSHSTYITGVDLGGIPLYPSTPDFPTEYLPVLPEQ